MKRVFLLAAASVALAAIPQNAKAGTLAPYLADWCVNVNGDINTACNGAGNGSAAINVSAFDKTLEPAADITTGLPMNGLGAVVITLGPGSNQYAAVYMDYDLNWFNEGAFLDFGVPSVASPGGGITFELDDPGYSNIFSDFSVGVLQDTNTVGSGVNTPPTTCCDVAWALRLDLNVPISATVTFSVSGTAPASGFYLTQSNLSDGTSIYLSAAVQQQPVIPNVPEPSTLGLLVSGGLLLTWKRFRPAR